jgi:hypothetical protein
VGEYIDYGHGEASFLLLSPEGSTDAIETKTDRGMFINPQTVGQPTDGRPNGSYDI